ncbi:MAG: type III-A CRISPR-associated protein Csm2 [Selenomonadaceae bacterium]|nr:type III-A CRISPR-associated protein Csm2 [Selenomonadaceae bacterium]
MTENESYVDEAMENIKTLMNAKNEKRKPSKIVSTSQIRNLLSMTADIYNQVKLSATSELAKDIKDQLQYLKVRIVYDAGREESVKEFVKTCKILEKLHTVETKEDYIQFSRYMEALVAWRKYLCGKDD